MLLLLLFAAWIVPGLVGHDPWKPDEAYGFGLVKHILDSGDVVVPSLAGEPFLEKPPLYYVTAAGTARLFSRWLPLHDGARLASAFYLAIAFLFTGLAGNELWGKERGWLAPVVLLGCPGLVVHTHKLITDVALFAGFAVALHGFALAPRRPVAAGLLIGTGTGIGFLSKGLLAPGVAGLTGLLLLAQPGLRTKRLARALCVGVAASLPWLLAWPAALYHRSPELFGAWLWTNNVGRFLGRVHLGPPKEPGFYLYALPYLAGPALFLAAWRATRRCGAAGLEPQLRVPLTAFLAMFAVLAAAADAREVYALPMLLPLSLLAAPAVCALPERAADALARLGTGLAAAAGLAVVAGWLAMTTGWPAALWAELHRIHPGYVPSPVGRGPLAAAALAACWLAALPGLSRLPGRAALAWAAGAAAAWGLAMTLWLPWLDAGMSYRPVMAALRQALPGERVAIASEGLGEPQRALLDYMADIETRRVEAGARADNNDFLLVQGAPGRAADPGPGWRMVWEGSRPGDGKELFVLFRRETAPR